MPEYCCIKQCRKSRKDGVSLYKFPHKREDHMKKWLQNIGDINFKPRKSHVICSAHFQQKDFLSTNGTLLMYGAIPSIFPVSQTSTIAVEELTVNSEPAEQAAVLDKSIANSHPTTSSTVHENIKMNNVSAPTKYRKVHKKGIMNSNTFHFKNQEFTPSERKMQREINTLRQTIRRRDKKILLLQNLLEELRKRKKSHGSKT